MESFRSSGSRVQHEREHRGIHPDQRCRIRTRTASTQERNTCPAEAFGSFGS